MLSFRTSRTLAQRVAAKLPSVAAVAARSISAPAAQQQLWLGHHATFKAGQLAPSNPSFCGRSRLDFSPASKLGPLQAVPARGMAIPSLRPKLSKDAEYEFHVIQWLCRIGRNKVSYDIYCGHEDDGMMTIPATARLEISHSGGERKDNKNAILTPTSAEIKRPLKEGTDGRLVVPISGDDIYNLFLVVNANSGDRTRVIGFQLKTTRGPHECPFYAKMDYDERARAFDAAAAAEAAEAEGATSDVPEQHRAAWRLASRAGLTDFIPVVYVMPFDDECSIPRIVVDEADLLGLRMNRYDLLDMIGAKPFGK